MANVSAQVVSHPAVFTTKTQYVLPGQKYMIPATWRRYQLSQLINKVLALPQPVPFDFLIHGEVVRTSIESWCIEHGIGEEETLEIEYIESLMPPQRMASVPQDDWVSSVSCQITGYILSGSYDGNVRLFDSSQKPVHIIPGHIAPVTSVCWVNTTEPTPESRLIASASHDRTARLTRVPAIPLPDTPGPATSLASLHLHTAPVSSVSSNPAGSLLLTASWDGLLGVWDTSIPDADEVPPEEAGEERKKRRRLAGPVPVRKAPVHVMKSHTARISHALFAHDASTAYSCALDSTLRSWDTSLGVCSGTVTLSEKPLTDLALLADSRTALCASTDRTVALLDLRTGVPAPVSTLGFSHSALPCALAAHPTDSQRAMSAAYDGIVRVWDLRSVHAPVASFKTGKDQSPGKLLSLDWGKGIGAVGGEDGIEVWKIGEGGERVE